VNYNPKLWKKVILFWVETPYAVTECPHCKIGILEIKDESSNRQANVIYRHVKCNNCGVTETFTMPDPATL
jgi:predicted RNA-binding Zn-ribbon protein involved in translation (DUF1610 family)